MAGAGLAFEKLAEAAGSADFAAVVATVELAVYADTADRVGFVFAAP